MKKNTIILFTIIFTIFSCNTWKQKLHHTGNKDDAIHNVIIDYLHTTNPPTKTFEVFDLDENKKSYYFDIEPRDYYLWQEKIGQKTIALPTKYEEVNGNLFFWIDSTQVVTKELIKVLQKYKVIDSLGWKVLAAENGFDLLDSVPEGKNYSKWEKFYIVCKDSIHKYKRLKKFIWKKEELKKIENKICK